MADSEYRNEFDEEDEDEEIDESNYKTPKDAILFAIDISESMMAAPPASDSKKADRDPPAIAALKCANHLMQQRIISNPKDMMGILLYGTQRSKFQDEDETSNSSLSYPHCYLLTDLDIPAATDVKQLRILIEEEEELPDLLTPSEKPVAMSSVLFCANQVFTTKAPNFASRRLFLVTDNDDPHKQDKGLRSSAAVRAKDLYDLGVTIELFPISRQDRKFDRARFYDDIIYRTEPSDPDAPLLRAYAAETSLSSGDGISLLTSLTSEINSKITPRRALFSNLALELSPSLRISVKGFLLLHRQKHARSCYVYTGGEVPEIAKLSTTLQADDTAREVENWEIRKAYKFGGEQIPFTPDEITELRNFGDPVIRIIGFKPIAMLPFWANLKHSTFIYPCEDDYIGSTRVFSALYQQLLDKQKMALTWFIARKNATSTMAAMIPGPPPGAENSTLSPQGLWLIPLPYADDLRSNPETPFTDSNGNLTTRASDALIDKMRPIVQQLRLPGSIYDPSKYPNPALQWHYRILQALALDEDLPEQAEDKTIPRYRQIDKRIAEYVYAWNDVLENECSNLPNYGIQTSTLAKRPAPSDKGAPATKRIKSEGDDGLSDASMRMMWEKGTLAKLTVAQLKEWLTRKGEGTAGKKADLVERVEACLESK